MYRITGDTEWQEKGWKMFEAVIESTSTTYGHSAVSGVADGDLQVLDQMESFWLAETLKYFYLLYTTPDTISLDEWVLNTEAHPFRRPTWGVFEVTCLFWGLYPVLVLYGVEMHAQICSSDAKWENTRSMLPALAFKLMYHIAWESGLDVVWFCSQHEIWTKWHLHQNSRIVLHFKVGWIDLETYLPCSLHLSLEMKCTFPFFVNVLFQLATSPSAWYGRSD